MPAGGAHDEDAVDPFVRKTAEWAWRLLVILAAIAAVLWLLIQLKVIAVPVALAVILTALLLPAVDWLDRRGAPRGGAVALILLTGFAVFGGIMSFVVSQFISGLPGLTEQVARSIDNATQWLIDGPAHLSREQIDKAGDTAVAALRRSGVKTGALVGGETSNEEGLLLGNLMREALGSFDLDSRADIEERLRRNDVKAVVATSALGMGYDKPDLGFCLHVGSPSTPVAYYQQVGRAGRGLDHAIAVLLSSEADERIWEFFATASIPDPADITKVLSALNASGPASVIELDSATGIRRGRLDTLLKILAVDDVVTKNGSKWATTNMPYVHDTQKWDTLRRVRNEEADIMRRYARGNSCLMELLQVTLDDPSPAPCGRCSVCTGTAPGPGFKPDMKWLQAAREFSRGVEVVIEPRKLWPSGVTRRGKIKGLSLGRAVAFADDPGWSDLLRDMRNGNYGVIPDELIAGAHDALKRWSSAWTKKPVAIVVAPAFGSEAKGNQQFANAIAQTLGLPVFTVFSWEGSATPAGVSSAPFVDHLEQVLRIDATAGIPAGPVILCATTMRTGWTQTVAAEMLQEIGVSTVLPFVIHRLP